MTPHDCFGCPGPLSPKATSPRYRTRSPSSSDPPSRFCWSVPTPDGTSVAPFGVDRWQWSPHCSVPDGCGSARTPAVTGSPRPACSCPMARPSPDSPAIPPLPRSMPRRGARCRRNCWARCTTEGAVTSHLRRKRPNPLCDKRFRSPACLPSQRALCHNRDGRTPGSAGSVMSMVVIGMSSRCENLAETIDPSPAARRPSRPGSGLSPQRFRSMKPSILPHASSQADPQLMKLRSKNECGAPS